MKLLEMGRDMKVKHSVSSPPAKYGRTFFAKKLSIGKQTFLVKLIEENILHGEQLSDHAREKLMVKRFQRPIKLDFLSLTQPELWICYLKS